VTDTKGTTTPLDRLVEHLRSCDRTADGVARPAAILWTDPERQWLPLTDLLRQEIEELFVLGDYDPESRTGPAIWMRCVIERSLSDVKLDSERIPIVYMPGVSRQELRAGEDCPKHLQPLVELLYRGTQWHQRSGRDWSLAAFFSADGLDLDLARDQETLHALQRALREVARTPLGHLEGRRLDGQYFDTLLTGDLVRDLLDWMNDPKATKKRMSTEEWTAFTNQCKKKWSCDPDSDGETTAGEKLGLGEGAWEEVWARFEEAPAAYPGIPTLLDRCKPGGLYLERDRWPSENANAESHLRDALEKAKDLHHPDLCTKIKALEAEHAMRRDWIWARMGRAPLAQALEHLARLATVCQSSLGGAKPDEIAATYMDKAWVGDAASWEAIAAAPVAEEPLIGAVVQALLSPWLDESAKVFQRATKDYPLPKPGEGDSVVAEPGGCILFSDGLRYDVGRRLAERLEHRGCRVQVGHRWSVLPTVTATAKPAITPIAGEITGKELKEDFAPTLKASDRPADAKGLRATMKTAGYEILGGTLGDWPSSAQARGWLEDGDIDSLGHKLQGRLANSLDDEIERLVGRILGLLKSGWTAVRIVTDHGWLLVPGGMPRVDLPKHLTESRWARCATISGDSRVEVPTYPWYWNESEYFAAAPGIGCFKAGTVYAHGGISIQECLTPDLIVELSGEEAAQATIRSITWTRMRCFIVAQTSGTTLTCDLRLETPTGESVAASPKALDEDGSTSLLLKSDDYEDSDLVLVLLDQDKKVLVQKKTRIGQSS